MERFDFDDIKPGAKIDCGSFDFTRESIIAFAREYDPQPFHVDDKAGAQSWFAGLVASGWQVCSAAMRLATDHFLCKTQFMGSPGFDEIKWLKPVRPGDRIELVLEITSTRPSKKNPDVGYAEMIFRLFNQHGQDVARMRGTGIFHR